ncbi:MAG: hypothetical protein M3Y23_06600 [Actinomycetota bacterium]|nr:hypothetical protein [Actinomycetota bacterium]
MKTSIKLVAAVVLAALAAAPVANAADPPPPPPPPVKADGTSAKVFATGVDVPTQFAFSPRLTFIAGGQEQTPGGIYFVRRGSKKAVKIKGSPESAYGVVWSGGVLYATQDRNIVAYSKWKRNRFLKKRVVARGPKKSNGFSGLAVGPDNRLYTGASLTQEFDSRANPVKYSNTVVAVKKSGRGGLKIVSRGLRQPWQMTFAKGEKSPIVSNLSQETPEGNSAPDFLARATPGSNFGFPTCSWEVTSPCQDFTDPLVFFAKTPPAPSPSPMGISARGKKLFVALFNGLPGQGPGIVTLNSNGTGVKPFLGGYVAPVLSVAHHKGFVYTGDLTGTIYRVEV